jgi:hypothetical protein
VPRCTGACAEFDFFYLTRRGVDPELSERMMKLAAKALWQHLERHRGYASASLSSKSS